MSSNRVDAKLVLLGRQYSGKTCLVERYLNERFLAERIPYQCTIGAAYGARNITIDKEQVTLGIWDTAGHERYEAMSKIYYRNAFAAIVCYDISDSDSWTKVEFWCRELRKHEPNCLILLCGTKKDLVDGSSSASPSKRQVDIHDAEDFCKSNGVHSVIETSSKTGENVHQLFHLVAELFIERRRANQINPIRSDGLVLDRSSSSAPRQSSSSSSSSCKC